MTTSTKAQLSLNGVNKQHSPEPGFRHYGRRKARNMTTDDSLNLVSMDQEKTPQPDSLHNPTPPPFSRACSLPIYPKLGTLKHPRRSFIASNSGHGYYSEPTPMDDGHFPNLPTELADAIQCLVQTLVHISPRQLLDSGKEQYSAYSLNIPSASVAAMFTTLRLMNYITANIGSFRDGGADDADCALCPLEAEGTDFDIGELLQNAADALGGCASEAGVDFALTYADIAIKRTWVHADESALSYAVFYLLRQILFGCAAGDAIELDLQVTPILPSSTMDRETTPVQGSRLQCRVAIFHRFHGASGSQDGTEMRPKPAMSSPILRNILARFNATLQRDLSAPAQGRSYELTLDLDSGSPPSHPAPPPTDVQAADLDPADPSSDELNAFTESLKGKKVELYASPDGSFARQLSSNLTVWGLDVDHISSETERDPDSSSSPSSIADGDNPSTPPSSTSGNAESREFPQQQSIPLTVIDDNVDVLKGCLQALTSEERPPTQSKKGRPSLAANHRPRSYPLLPNSHTHAKLSRSPPLTIVHFTSLSNFTTVKDIIGTRFNQHSLPVPQVMVLTKPSGPRRFLTALYTALKKPVVDPLFLPIATSPGISQLASRTSFLEDDAHHNENNFLSPRASPTFLRPPGSRTASERSLRPSSHPDTPGVPLPPSPLAQSETVEYFPINTGVQLGSTASAGMMLQSPDGQHSIFFQPRKAAKSLGTPPTKAREYSIPPGQSVPSGRSQTTPHPEKTRLALDTGNINEPTPVVPTALSPPSATRSHDHMPERPPQEPAYASSPPASKPLASETSQRKHVSRKSSDTEGKKGGNQSGDNIVPPINVLIVEDNPLNRTILATSMKKLKVKHDTATNGKEAVDKWKTGAFHLVLMDIQMPIMDGIEATKQIRRLEKANSAAGFPLHTPPAERMQSIAPIKDANSPLGANLFQRTGSTPSAYMSAVIIVALTASNSQIDRDRALAAGCNDFLTKPVSLVWLHSKIIEWGSIKALQMWTDLRPPISEASVVAGQNADRVASNLHIGASRSLGSNERDRGAGGRKVSPIPSALETPFSNQGRSTAQGNQQTRVLPGQPSSPSQWKQDVANDIEEALGHYEYNSDDNEDDAEESLSHQVPVLEKGPPRNSAASQRTEENRPEDSSQGGAADGDPPGAENRSENIQVDVVLPDEVRK